MLSSLGYRIGELLDADVGALNVLRAVQPPAHWALLRRSSVSSRASGQVTPPPAQKVVSDRATARICRVGRGKKTATTEEKKRGEKRPPNATSKSQCAHVADTPNGHRVPDPRRRHPYSSAKRLLQDNSNGERNPILGTFELVTLQYLPIMSPTRMYHGKP